MSTQKWTFFQKILLHSVHFWYIINLRITLEGFLLNESDLELYGIVGKMFREIRENRGYTLEFVSDYLNITPKSLQRYECGERKIKVSTIKSLCNFYSIDCSNFMKEAKVTFASDCIHSDNKKNNLSKPFNNDIRLQKIIDCYNNMNEEGKTLLSNQAEFFLSQYPKIVKKEEAI